MAIKSIKLPGGQEIQVDEWLQWPLYSTLVGQGNITQPDGSVAGASIQLSAFSYVVGDRIPQAGVPAGAPYTARTSDTNIVVRNKVNHDEAIVVFSVTFEIFALDASPKFGDPEAPVAQATEPIFTATNLRRLQRDAIFEVICGANIRKPQIRAPFSYIGQGMGAVAYGSGDALSVNYAPAGGGANVTSLAFSYGNSGMISPSNQRRFTLPVFIHSDTTLKAPFYTPNGPVRGLNQDWRLRITLDGLKRRPIG
jgi:hypothetical protein